MIFIKKDGDKFVGFDETAGRSYSIAELEQMANNNDTEAQCAAGDYYNATSNFNTAKSWYEKAAAKNHARAQWNMSLLCAGGLGGCEKDMAKAKIWAKKSAEQDWPPAMLTLGQLYTMDNEYDDAIYWIEKADARGVPEAKTFLEQVLQLKTILGFD